MAAERGEKRRAPHRRGRVDRARRSLAPEFARPIRRKRILVATGSVFGFFALLVAGIFGYAYWRYGQFPKIDIPGLASRQPNQPFDILIVGSDSRAFAGTTGRNAQQYGSSTAIGGQRSDVTIVARVDPVNQTIHLLSIPRDTYVKIPGHVKYVSGYNRINTAYNDGPALLVKTIEENFHIPISDYIGINIEGLTNMVNAIGGVYLDFRYPVVDTYSHLGITRTGCHLVFGSQAVALVRSRHLYYKLNGKWVYDGMSDWSRIQRQDAFFRALLPRLKGIITSPTRLNSFLGAAEKNITIDRSMTVGEIISLANIFRHVSDSALVSETLPTAGAVINGADVLIPAPAQDEAMIKSFLAIGSAHTTADVTPALGPRPVLLSAQRSSSGVTVTTIPGVAAPPPSQVVNNTQPEPWNPIPCSGP